MAKDVCCIPGCNRTTGIHGHHVIPQAYGGVNGPVVPLCGAHHTLIHDMGLKNRADVREALIKDEPEAAKPKLLELAGIIVRARMHMATNRIARPLTLQVNLSAERADKLRELKQLLGVSSQDAVINACIDIVYKQKTPLRK